MRLAPIRARESVQLDGREVKARGIDEPLPLPPYMSWQQFRPWFEDQWEAGDHLALVGMTKSGKTTLARNLLRIRDFVVVFGTKARDDSLYKPLEKIGFVLKESWDPWEWQETGERFIIFAPPLDIPDNPEPADVGKALTEQADKFRTALVQIFKSGGWCCYFDEVRYLSDDLKLARELNLLWLQGRSLDVTIIAATQRPRAVPLNMFSMATWFFLWKVSDREDRRRASEFAGSLAPVVFETAARLPRNEFVVTNAVDDEILRSRVQL